MKDKRYERKLAKSKLKSHEKLTSLSLKWERKYTDAQFNQLKSVSREHRIYHEREHILYEDAIEKAAATLKAELSSLQTDVDRLRDQSVQLLTVERFEREHLSLAEKLEAAVSSLAEKVDIEEKVTVRQSSQAELIEKISTNNRWLIGILITVAIFGATTVLHVFKVF